MKPLAKLSNSPGDCALQVLATVPLVMRTIRREMRSRRPAGISVPQLRVLTFLRRNKQASLSLVAEHVGSTLPTVSKMVDALANKGLVARRTASDDRRRVILSLTETGGKALAAATAETGKRLAGILAKLPAEERALVAQAMIILACLFSPDKCEEMVGP